MRMLWRAVATCLVATILSFVAGCNAHSVQPTPVIEEPAVQQPPPPPPTPPPPPPPPPPRLQVSRILAFGDSMTEGIATPESWGVTSALTPGVARSYPAKLQALMSARYTDQTIVVMNGGIGGRNARDDLPRLVELLGETQPDLVILMEGINDLNGGAGITATANAMEEMVKAVRNRGIRLMLSTITRINPLGTKHLDTDPLVPPYNARLSAIAASKDAILVDVYPHIPLALMAPDGLHLSESGNQKLAEVYLDRIRELFEQAGAYSLMPPRRR
jgi:lysophospholipase L1-like esterase